MMMMMDLNGLIREKRVQIKKTEAKKEKQQLSRIFG